MNKLFTALALGASISASTPAFSQETPDFTFLGNDTKNAITDTAGTKSARGQNTGNYPRPNKLPLYAMFETADGTPAGMTCTSLPKRIATAAPAQKAEFVKADDACKAVAATFTNPAP